MKDNRIYSRFGAPDPAYLGSGAGKNKGTPTAPSRSDYQSAWSILLNNVSQQQPWRSPEWEPYGDASTPKRSMIDQESVGWSVMRDRGVHLHTHELLRPLTASRETLHLQSAARVTQGSSLDVLKGVADETYQTIVTSPPYYFVRDYGTGIKQIGLEKSRAAYIENLAAIFRECHRTLRSDGTMWLNIQDNYCTRRAIRSDGKRTVADEARARRRGHQRPSWKSRAEEGMVIRGEAQFRSEGIREKSLFNIPHMLVERLMQDGWVFRSEITWRKQVIVPEKARDAPSCTTEYIFLLTKASSNYVYHSAVLDEVGVKQAVRNHRDHWSTGPSRFGSSHSAVMPEELAARCILTGSSPGDLVLDPFGGAGTTAAIARLFGRSVHLIERNPLFIAIAKQRIDAVTMPKSGEEPKEVIKALSENQNATMPPDISETVRRAAVEQADRVKAATKAVADSFEFEMQSRDREIVSLRDGLVEAHQAIARLQGQLANQTTEIGLPKVKVLPSNPAKADDRARVVFKTIKQILTIAEAELSSST